MLRGVITPSMQRLQRVREWVMPYVMKEPRHQDRADIILRQ